jgi:hypothetical protein
VPREQYLALLGRSAERTALPAEPRPARRLIQEAPADPGHETMSP